MATVYLAIGSNVGDSKKHVFETQKLLCELIDCSISAPLYTSKAVGYTEQANFLNTVISGKTELSPWELLKAVKAVEAKVGRTKSFRWGPREIDIDIIFYDDLVLDSPELTIPHPRYSERDFVLRPLCDICVDLIDPISKQSVKELVELIPKKHRSIISTEN